MAVRCSGCSCMLCRERPHTSQTATGIATAAGGSTWCQSRVELQQRRTEPPYQPQSWWLGGLMLDPPLAQPTDAAAPVLVRRAGPLCCLKTPCKCCSAVACMCVRVFKP